MLALHADTPQTVDIMNHWKAVALFLARDYAPDTAVLRGVSGHAFLRARLLAACHTRLGQPEDARAQADIVLDAQPEFRLRNVRLWKSFRNPDLRDALREAGLPE